MPVAALVTPGPAMTVATPGLPVAARRSRSGHEAGALLVATLHVADPGTRDARYSSRVIVPAMPNTVSTS